MTRVAKSIQGAQATYSSSLEWVAVDSMVVNLKIQRQHYDQKRAEKIAADLDPDKLGKPLLWARPIAKGEELQVIDGNHRRMAVMIALGSGQKMECEVIRDPSMTEVEAAKLFLGRNNFKAPNIYDRFIVSLTAQDPDCVNMNKIIMQRGLRITQKASDGGVACIGCLMGIYRRDQRGQLLESTLALAIEAWESKKETFNGDVLAGLSRVLQKHRRAIDFAWLRKKLAQRSVEKVLAAAREAKNVFPDFSLPDGVSRTIISHYNLGRRGPKLPEWKS